MFDSLLIVVPVFGLIALGLGARSVGLVSARAGEGLSEFVYTVAIPALIFRTLIDAQLPQAQPWGYWLSYFAGVAVVWALAMLIAARIFGVTGAALATSGFAAGQSNTVLIGIPLILKAYGEAGAVPLFLLLAVHLPVTMTAATLLAEGRQADGRKLARSLASQPILVAIVVGVLARWLGFNISGPARAIVDALAGAAIPCALFAMGMALRRYGLRAGLGLPLMLSGLKLLLHPAIVFVLAFQVFAIDPVWAGVAVLFAASPSGINAYLFAERYKAGVDIASSAVALSTGLSVLTTALWLIVLGRV